MKSKMTRILCFTLCLLLLGSLFACKDPEQTTKETFMVTFSKNIEVVTVSGMPSPQNIEEGKKVSRPQTNPSTALYNFTGWYEDQACTTPFNFDTVTVTKRLTIYAGWELKVTNYKVTFDLNYDGASAPTEVTVVSGATVSAPIVPVRNGYIFISWSTQQDANYSFNFSNQITRDTNLYAIWEQTFTLTYQFNSTEHENVIETYSETQNTVRPSDPVRNNFSFGGWFKDAQFTIPFTHGTPLTENTVVYARWVRVSYTVTFDLNYQGSTPLIIRANINSDVPVPAAPTRSGYVFTNWYTSATVQTDAELYDFAAVTNDNTIVYAGWAELHTVTFNLNYEGAPQTTTQIIQNGQEIESVTPSREGYLFSGWYTDASYQHVYVFGPVTEDFVLYAKWTDASQVVDEFTVTFDLNFEGSVAITQIVAGNTSAIRPTDPTRPGYRFQGWMTTPTGSTSYRFTAVTEDVVVYARWVNIWTVTFNLGYEGAPTPQVIETLDGTRISKPENPTRSGLWQFVTWNDASGSPFIFTTLIKQDHQLTAVWARSGYNVTLNFNFTGAPAPVVSEVLLGSIVREPQKPHRDGNWAISGWFLDEALTIPFSLASEVSEDIVLYAKWASGYAYRLDLNFLGASSIPTQILSEGQNIPQRPTNPVRAGFTFVGWATSATGNPTFDSFGQPITQDITLYAQWRHTYIFEAEYVSLAGKNGAGWSGGAAGTAMITKDTITSDPELGTNANASNGFFLSYLYSYGLFIDFVITSDRQVEATLILRLSAEQRDPFTITDSEYLITLNGQKINYGSITMTGAFAALAQRKLPFQDVISIPITLSQGVNVIRFTTNNQNSMGGTMDATAPLIDCIKIDTIANLSWEPVLENLDLFN